MTCSTVRFAWLAGLIALLLVAGAPGLRGQTPSTTLKRIIVSEETQAASAGVTFDRRVLFRVPAVPAYTAETVTPGPPAGGAGLPHLGNKPA